MRSIATAVVRFWSGSKGINMEQVCLRADSESLLAPEVVL